MALILNIDTATEYGAVGFSESTTVIALKESRSQKEHASFLQSAIKQMVKETGISLTDIVAVSVTIGPGSYTGLRVGLASAKGICYALNKPLIVVNTLQVMALASIQNSLSACSFASPILYCPMIDARRMEVFSALYDKDCKEKSAAKAVIIDENIYKEELMGHQIIFSGSGAHKIKNILAFSHAFIAEIQHNIGHLACLAWQKYTSKDFADVAYCEPFYLKAFIPLL